MAAGATTAAVKKLIETDEADANIDQFVADANDQVDDLLGTDGLSDARLTRIANYLAAYLVTLRDPRVTRTKSGETSDDFDQGKDRYLRMAAGFDPTGKIAAEFGLDTGATRKQFAYAGEWE